MAVTVLLALVAAYVTLPWWAPARLLADWLEGEMARQMGVGVRIESLRLSWGNGAEIRRLTIDSPPSFGSSPMAVVERLRMDFSPVDILFRKKVAWMEMDRPQLLGRIDSDGNANFAPLAKLHFDAEPERVSIRQAAVTLRLPDPNDRVLGLRVSDVEFVAGQLQRLGRVTVSASLEQTGGRAPVGLNLAAGEGEDDVAAAATFNFANVDLAQLPIAKLLKLPLEKLSGRCGGSVKLKINREGIVEHFDLNVAIRQLDVQPVRGPRLPVIEEAGLNAQATFDPIGDRIELHQASVRLPGMELSGRGTMSTRVGAGEWEAIQSLDLSGKLYPDRLAALLKDQARLPYDLRFNGPVSIERLLLSHAGPRIDLTVVADCAAAAILQGERTIKPAGRKLAVRLAAVLDDRTWALDANEARVSLGGNTFTAQGRLPDVRRLRGTRRAGSLRDFFEVLCQIECEGAWEVHELDSLRDLHPAIADALRDVRLRGGLSGSWSVDRRTRTRVDAVLNAPAETQLAVRDVFVKPRDLAMGLVIAGTIEPGLPAVKDLAVDFKAGPARFSLSAGQLQFTEGTAESAWAGVDARGEFEVAGVELLARWVPPLAALKDKVRGAARGAFTAALGGDVQRAGVWADLRNLEIAWEDAFTKPAGQEAAVELGLLSDRKAPPAERNQLNLTWRCKEAEFTATAFLPELLAEAAGTRGRLDASAKVSDVRWLTASCPALRAYIKDARIAGSLAASASGAWQGRRIEGDLSFNADGLEYTSPGPARYAKMAGVPLNGKLAGWADDRGKEGLIAEIRSASVELAECRADLAGRAVLDLEALRKAGPVWPQPGVREFQGRFDATLTAEESIGRLIPDLAALVRRHGLEGQVQATGEAAFDGKSLSLKSHIDAGKLAVANFLPLAADEPNGPYKDLANAVGPLLKPKGTPAEADLEMTATKDLSHFRVSDLRARVGELDLLADAVLTARPDDRGLPTDLAVESAHVSVSTSKVEDLVRLCPRLAEYKPAGDLFADVEWKGADGGRFPYAAFHVKDLRGRYRGRDVLLAGELTLQDVRPQKVVREQAGLKTEKWELQIDGVRTAGLEFRAGQNHGWLLADVRSLGKDPNGAFHVLMEYVDDKDLTDWLSDPNESPPRGRALTAGDERQLQDRANRFIRQGRDWLAGANLTGRLSVERMRTFDSDVGEYYDIHALELTAAADRGRVGVRCEASVNGGTYLRKAEVNLGDAEPLLLSEGDIRDVIATRNVQPQLARYFPGNTVNGYFNRTEKLTMPLRDVVASSIDARWPLHPVGTATTVAIDGVVEGRAAPRFVTTFFPGLNLTKFKYNKMTGFAKYLHDGSAENEMIFSGAVYDVYMEGRTGADNIGEYEIGLVLLGSTVSPQVHYDLKQGRIPILKFKGRIEGGKIHDEEVSYPWPHQTAFVIFLKNNPVYRIWLAAQRK